MRIVLNENEWKIYIKSDNYNFKQTIIWLIRLDGYLDKEQNLIFTEEKPVSKFLENYVFLFEKELIELIIKKLVEGMEKVNERLSLANKKQNIDYFYKTTTDIEYIATSTTNGKYMLNIQKSEWMKYVKYENTNIIQKVQNCINDTDYLDKIGVRILDRNGNRRDLFFILNDIRKKLKDITRFNFVKILEHSFNQEHYLNFSNALTFYNNNQKDEFVLSYKEFFKEEFVDFLENIKIDT